MKRLTSETQKRELYFKQVFFPSFVSTLLHSTIFYAEKISYTRRNTAGNVA